MASPDCVGWHCHRHESFGGTEIWCSEDALPGHGGAKHQQEESSVLSDRERLLARMVRHGATKVARAELLDRSQIIWEIGREGGSF